MMKKGYRSGLVLVAGIGFAMIAGMASRASAAAVLGNYNLRIEGYELLTPTGGGSAQKDDIEGIGQLVVSSAGSISGAETFTAVDAAAATEEVCNGSVTGTIFPPAGGFASGSGDFTISLTYAPTSTGATCIPSTASLVCSRALLHTTNAANLGAGEYHCIVTGLAAGTGATMNVNGASLKARLNLTRGSNGPTS